MSKQIVLSQHMFLAIEGAQRALKLLGHGEYRFKDATLQAPQWSGSMIDESAVSYLVQIKGRVYVKGQKPKKLKAEMYIRAYPQGGPAPILDWSHAQILCLDGNEYRTFFREKKRMYLNLWYTDPNPVNPGYNPPQLKFIAEEQE
jgi:hypothetical protein